MDFILGHIILIVLDDISLWLMPIVEPIVEPVIGESGVSYVHWDWCVIVLSRHIG